MNRASKTENIFLFLEMRQSIYVFVYIFFTNPPLIECVINEVRGFGLSPARARVRPENE
jgi:hypothetical protein